MRMNTIKRFSAILLVFSITIGLMVSNITTAKASYSEDVILNVPWTLINECGNQYELSGHKLGCQAYSFAYCRIILDNQAHKWTDYRAKNSAYLAVSFAEAGYTNEHSLSKQEVLKAVYDNINNGRPVVLNVVSQYTSGHYVVAIGYKSGCNPNSIKESDIIIIDPTNRNITSTSRDKENYTNLGATYSLKCNTNNYNLYQYGTAKSGGVAISTGRTTTNDVGTVYTVTFDPNGGSVSQGTKTVAQGSTLDALPLPTRSGYTFICWSTVKEGAGSALTADNYKWLTFDKNTTLYAQWKQNCINHTYDAETCTSCGATLPYDNGLNVSAAGTYQVSANTAYIRTGPYQVKDLVRTANQGEFVQVVGSVINSYNNTWMKTTDGYYVHADKLILVNGTQPTSNEPEIPNGVYTLAPLCALGSRLDVAGADWRDNANVQIHESNGTLAQQWELTHLGDGYYQLICKASGKALDVSQAGTEPGTNVQQFTPNNTYAQQWRITNAADGSFFLIPRINEDLCLDVSGAGSANGTNVQVYTANGSAAQMWDLTCVDSSSTSNPGPIASVPQYFSCNVGIFCVNGKTVNLYNNPGDSSRVDYFSLGQSVGSSYGVNMPDGSTWYQVSVTSKGNVITVWLKYESDKMTVRNLG